MESVSLKRYLDSVMRKARLFLQISSEDGFKAAFSRAVLSIQYRLTALVMKAPATAPVSIATDSSELDALRENLRHCQDSIRQLAALLAATDNGIPAPAGPRISVIMPVYNRAGIIPGAIRSVLSQKGADFELIVVDDGSTDELNDVAVPELKSGLVRLLRLPHRGVCAARNHGVSTSAGEVIVYLDSDNRMYPGYLRAVAAAYSAAPRAECGHAAMLWDNGRDAVHLRHDEFSISGLLANKVNIDLNCFSHRKSLWQKLGGFDEKLNKHSDYDLVLRYAREHSPIRIFAVAARYYAGNAFSRISLDQDTATNITYIRAKYRRPSGRKPRVLITCYDYPQSSESYIHTEIAFLLRKGYQIEVCSKTAPGSPGIAQVRVRVGGLQRAIDEFQPDLIHAHWLPIGTETAEVAHRAGLPVTVRSHGFEFTPDLLKRCTEQPAVVSIYLFPHLAMAMPGQHPKVRGVPAAFNTTRFYPRQQRNSKMVLRTAACLDSKDIELFFEVAARCPEFTFVLALAKIALQPDLPNKFETLNASLGNPVDLRFDVAYEKMAELVGRAAIYLHTFGFKEAFGMPVSIAESLACGAVAVVRDCPQAREYAGPHSLYYNNVAEAVGHIHTTLSWSVTDWQKRAQQSADFARERYADEIALAAIHYDWCEILQEPAPQPAQQLHRVVDQRHNMVSTATVTGPSDGALPDGFPAPL